VILYVFVIDGSPLKRFPAPHPLFRQHWSPDLANLSISEEDLFNPPDSQDPEDRSRSTCVIVVRLSSKVPLPTSSLCLTFPGESQPTFLRRTSTEQKKMTGISTKPGDPATCQYAGNGKTGDPNA